MATKVARPIDLFTRMGGRVNGTAGRRGRFDSKRDRFDSDILIEPGGDKSPAHQLALRPENPCLEEAKDRAPTLTADRLKRSDVAGRPSCPVAQRRIESSERRSS